MARTQISGAQIFDGGVGREDVNTLTSGKALITKLITGDGLTISNHTGIDEGTGDVTLLINYTTLDAKYLNASTARAQNTVLAGPLSGSGVPTFRVLSSNDIPSLDWGKINSGKPTTLAGYGITDAVSINHTHTKSQITDFPTLPTTLPASDVYPWAKAATKPSYNASEVGAMVTTGTNGAINGLLLNTSTLGRGIYNGNWNTTNYWGIGSGPTGSQVKIGVTDINGVFQTGDLQLLLGSSNKIVATTDQIPSSLPASDVYAWAKASVKPSYTAAEVGASTNDHTHSNPILIQGLYTSDGGQQPPSYVPSGKVRFNMMNNVTNGDTSYKDWLLMDTYGGSDVPITTGFGISKSTSLRAFIMQGTKAGPTWDRVAELYHTGNLTNLNQLSNGPGYITNAGRAYPKRIGDVDLNFNWAGQGGQPPWLWGGSDGSNMYVYNPSNFSVNYANSAGSANKANQLQAFTEDNFTGGDHYIKAIRSTSGWSMRLKTCYDGGAATTNDVSVSYADGAGNADTVDNLHSNSFLRRDTANDFYGKMCAIEGSRSGGMYGVYDSTKIGHIWSMGTSYAIPDSGANFGSLYGLAYKHTNNGTGGNLAGGHQMVWCQGGNPTAAMGDGFWTSGNSYAAGFYINSARKLKENISDLKFNALSLINEVKVVSFNYISDKEKNFKIGFIADDTDAILSTKDHNTMDLYNTSGLLIKSIQELSKKIERLEKQIFLLKHK